ncbi:MULTISPECIES: ABC transporter permease DevC [Synechocystis]|uniref:FtsX-like permease family protein n=1 Tax=Synechocystis salina LEGE 00031 TaxID=1828736 RepID=A0ABR9VNC1_9SYNC|nr:FtsX-like permease family protein [Synechocystis sp. FACHB-383]MBE9240014.1 FtsX-like permease family protein [Synechocystis salina LEGE 00041]MBE9252566.1 FtsX-like permease family protein [Synechocystis salina LEGE 00031]
MKIPTAWLQLKFYPLRLVVAVAGVCFSIFLIFMQLSFQDALFDSAVSLYEPLDADIFILSSRSSALIAMENFPERRLSQSLAVENVAEVIPLYLGFAQWRNPVRKNYWRSIYIIGIDPSQSVFNLKSVEENRFRLQLPDTVLFNEHSRAEYGPIPELFRQRGELKTEIGDRGSSNREVTVVGLFPLGISFGADGTILTSDLNFQRILPGRKKGFINLGGIKLQDESKLDITLEALRDYLPNDVKVFSKAEIFAFEKNYWATGSPIGFVFALGVGIGLSVGVVITYQVLYSSISQHLSEYATLRAVGYRQRYLLGVVFQEAVFLALFAYVPGIIFTSFATKLARDATNLPVYIDVNKAIIVLLLSCLMCFVSGGIAVRKLQDADPADVFY